MGLSSSPMSRRPLLWWTSTGSATPMVMSSSPMLSSLMESCSPPPETSLPLDTWKDAATAELKDIKEASGAMLPEDRVARTMDLQEDIAAKLEILAENAKNELELLPQGDKVPADAQAFKDELKRITDYVKKLQGDTKIECDKYSNDVKYWAEYRTGIKEFNPWLAGADEAANGAAQKMTTHAEADAEVAGLKERYVKVKAV